MASHRPNGYMDTASTIKLGDSATKEGDSSVVGITLEMEDANEEKTADPRDVLSRSQAPQAGTSKSSKSKGLSLVRTQDKLKMIQAEIEKELRSKESKHGVTSLEKTSSRTKDVLEQKMAELKELRQRSRAKSATTSATRAKLAEVNMLLEMEMRNGSAVNSSRTRDILDEKMKELMMLKGKVTTTKTRDELMRIMKEIEMEKDKLTSSQTMAEYKRHQALLEKMKKANARQGDADVAFMLDCTGSMIGHINAAKEHVKAVIDEIMSRFNCRIRVAFVGYRDHCDGENRIQTLDFVEDVNQFTTFLAGVAATGGGDTCEDVFGGLEAAINLSWMMNNKCLIHIGDAPPHGRRFHDGEVDDDELFNDADRRGLRIENLIEKMKSLGLDYTFGKINNSTDKMLRVFNEIGGAGFSRCSDMADIKNFPFFAIESISATIECNWKDMTGVLLPKPKFGGSTAISEKTEKSLKPYSIIKSKPEWNGISMQPVRIAHCKVTDGKKLELKLEYKKASIKISHHPFAEGSQRIAYYGIEIGKSSHFFSSLMQSLSNSSVVLKTFKHIYGSGINDGRDDFLNIVESQAIANHFAKEFNKIKPMEAREVHFLDVKLVEAQAIDGSPVYYTIEDMFPDYEFKKFNSNFGFVNLMDFTSTLNAFSHWTYDYTNHYLMVVDLQGILHNDRYVLTDPAIHCRELRFGRTNLGGVGMKTFFEAHKCNKVCSLMGLKSNRHMKDGTPNPDLSSISSVMEKLSI